MSEIFEKLGPILDAATSGDSSYNKIAKIERGLAGTSIALALTKGYKQKQYEDRVDQDAMDQWIEQAKLREQISKLKQDKEEIKSYTDALSGVPLENRNLVQNAIGNQIWQEVISTNEPLRNAGKAADYPTYADFEANKKFFNPKGAKLLEETYQEKLNNMIERVRTGRKIDIPLLQSHYNEIEKNQMNTDFISSSSLVDLYGGRTEKKFKQKQDILSKYKNVFLTETIKDNSIAFEDLKNSKTVAESQQKLLNHKFSDIARMSNTNLAIHHMLPDVVRKESFTALDSAFAAREIVLGRRLTKDEIDEESNMVMFSMANPTEGVRAAYKQRAADLKDIYRDTSLTSEQKKLQIGMIDIALAKHIKAVGSIGDFSEAELKIHEIQGLEGIEDILINSDVAGADGLKKRLKKSLSAPKSIRTILVNSIMSEHQSALQRTMNPSQREEAVQAEQKLLTALTSAGLTPTKNNVDLIVDKNPSLAAYIGPASALPNGKIYWRNYKTGFGDKAFKSNAGIYDSVMSKAEVSNPKLYSLMEDNKNNKAFRGGMSAWLANTKQGFKNLNNEQFLVRSFGNNGATVSADRAFIELISKDILLKNSNEIVAERDNLFVTSDQNLEGLSEEEARKIYSVLSGNIASSNPQLKIFEQEFGLTYRFDEEGNITDEGDISDEALKEISTLSSKQAAFKLNNYMQNWANKINNISETEEEKQNLIKENRESWKDAIEEYPELELELDENTGIFNTINLSQPNIIVDRLKELDNEISFRRQGQRGKNRTRTPELNTLYEQQEDLNKLVGNRRLIKLYENKTNLTPTEQTTLKKAQESEIKLSSKYGY